MPCSTFPIDPALGPVVEIGISPPRSLLAANAPAPAITWIKAIADTGCTHTSIFGGAATRAGLQVVSKTTVNSTSHSIPANVYLGDLFLKYSVANTAFEFRFRDRPFLELIRGDPNFESLLGMDILSIGTFYVNGQTKTATFCW